MTTYRWRLSARLCGAAAVIVLLLGLASTIGAQESSFGGLTVGSTGTSMTWAYNQPSAGIPASPTGEMNSIYTEGTLSLGSSYGLASIAWPGQTPANAPALVWQTFWHELTMPGRCPPEYCPKPDIDDPNYPVRAETFYPQGPEEQATEPAAGARMRSSAKAARVDASAAADDSGFSPFFTVGTQTSRSTEFVADGQAIAEARATVNDISMLSGLIKIGSVVSTVTAQSDGVKGRVAGNVVVSGMEIFGYPIRFDSTGFHDGDQDHDPGFTTVRQQIEQALGQAGVKLRLAGPIDSIEGTSASRSIGGLIISFAADSLRPYVNQMPAQMREEFERNVALDNSVHLSLAAVAARADATSPEALEPFDEPTDSDTFTGGLDTGFGAVDGGFASDGGDLGSPADPGTGAVPVTGNREGTLSAAPVSASPISTNGIPFWLIASALGVAALVSRWLSRAAQGALAAGAAGGRCPLERTDEDEM